MNDERLAASFRSLGDPTRLRIFRTLMEHCGPMGKSASLTAGEICRFVSGAEAINSTISHHMKELKQAGLIEIRRAGRFMHCRPKADGVRDMLSFLLDVE